MWYGAMGTFQILLFALIAIKIKANAPGAHTFPEIVSQSFTLSLPRVWDID